MCVQNHAKKSVKAWTCGRHVFFSAFNSAERTAYSEGRTRVAGVAQGELCGHQDRCQQQRAMPNQRGSVT